MRKFTIELAVQLREPDDAIMAALGSGTSILVNGGKVTSFKVRDENGHVVTEEPFPSDGDAIIRRGAALLMAQLPKRPDPDDRDIDAHEV